MRKPLPPRPPVGGPRRSPNRQRLIARAAVWTAVLSGAADAYARAQRPMDRIAGALMGAFGVRLLWVFD